jgi:hypothetical protein
MYTCLYVCIPILIYIRHPDLAALQEERAAEFRNAQKIVKREQIQNEKTAKKAREDAAKVRNYS